MVKNQLENDAIHALIPHEFSFLFLRAIKTIDEYGIKRLNWLDGTEISNLTGFINWDSEQDPDLNGHVVAMHPDSGAWYNVLECYRNPHAICETPVGGGRQ